MSDEHVELLIDDKGTVTGIVQNGCPSCDDWRKRLAPQLYREIEQLKRSQLKLHSLLLECQQRLDGDDESDNLWIRINAAVI